MRWEGAAKRQGGQAHCWQPGVGSRAWGSKHCRGWEGSWSNRSSQRSRTKCQPLVNQALPIPRVTFWLVNTRKICWSNWKPFAQLTKRVTFFIVLDALLVIWFVMKCHFEYAYGRTPLFWILWTPMWFSETAGMLMLLQWQVVCHTLSSHYKEVLMGEQPYFV